jgi:hypothetical protein
MASRLAADVSYRLLPPDAAEHQQSVAWLERAFPIASWGRIDWERVPEHRQLVWHEEGELVRALSKLIRGAAHESTEVLVLWTDASKPLLALAAREVLRHAADLLDVDWDAWILCPAENWCIEVYHEGEICFGAPPAA